MFLYRLLIHVIAMLEANHSSELIVIWTHDIDVLECFVSMCQFLRCAEIWNWFPDEERRRCFRTEMFLSEMQYASDLIDTSSCAADQMETLRRQQFRGEVLGREAFLLC